MRLTDEQIVLLPQLTLLAVALATLLLTASFDWLYPARVLVVGAVLLHYRKAFHLGALRLNPVALGIGLVVFLLWIVLIPAEPEKSAAFAIALFAAPGSPPRWPASALRWRVTTGAGCSTPITAHLTTNLLLGLFVLLGGQWCYW